MNPEQLKGHLDLLLLAVIEPGPAHGYAVIEHLRARSGGTFDLPEGTIYPALHRLEAAGWLVSNWEDAGGRRRRIYEITKAGKQTLAARRADWEAFSGGVLAVLKRGARTPAFGGAA